MTRESLHIENVVLTTARVFCALGWAGLLYAALTSEGIAADGYTLPYKHPDALSIIGVVCAAVSSACSGYYLRMNVDRVGAWVFAFVCLVPFLGIVALFHGCGAGEA